MGRPELWLVGHRLTVREWLVGSYEEGQRWPDPSSSSWRLHQRVYVRGRENLIGAHPVNKRSTLPINGLHFNVCPWSTSKNTTKKEEEEKEREKRTKTKREKHQLTFQPTSTAASPSPSLRADSSSETPQVSPSEPGCPSPPNCSWTIQLQHVLPVAHLRVSVGWACRVVQICWARSVVVRGPVRGVIRYRALSPGGFWGCAWWGWGRGWWWGDYSI